MKILVTGATGFLGFYVVKKLLEDGHKEIRCFVRPGSNHTRLEVLHQQFPAAVIKYCEGNLTSRRDAEKAVFGIDTIYHLAASLRGATPDMFLNTVVATKNILESIVKDCSNLRIVLVSSFSVYGVGNLPAGTLIDENTPLEQRPEKRDPYTFVKHRQEKLLWDYQKHKGFELVVLRPGVIYGPGGGTLSTRIGVNVFGLFLHFGRNNILPLSYAENCAEAIILAGGSQKAKGQVYNVHDDDLPTSKLFLKQYIKHVNRIRYITVPYFLTIALSKLVERYHHYSKGQLPAIFTPYKSACLWKGNTFSNTKLKSLGWQQSVPTRTGMQTTFEYLKQQSLGDRK